MYIQDGQNEVRQDSEKRKHDSHSDKSSSSSSSLPPCAVNLNRVSYLSEPLSDPAIKAAVTRGS